MVFQIIRTKSLIDILFNRQRKEKPPEEKIPIGCVATTHKQYQRPSDVKRKQNANKKEKKIWRKSAPAELQYTLNDVPRPGTLTQNECQMTVPVQQQGPLLESGCGERAIDCEGIRPPIRRTKASSPIRQLDSSEKPGLFRSFPGRKKAGVYNPLSVILLNSEKEASASTTQQLTPLCDYFTQSCSMLPQLQPCSDGSQTELVANILLNKSADAPMIFEVDCSSPLLGSTSKKFDAVEEFRRNFVKGLWSNPTVYSDSPFLIQHSNSAASQHKHQRKLTQRSQTLPSGLSASTSSQIYASSNGHNNGFTSPCSERICEYSEVVVDVDRCAAANTGQTVNDPSHHHSEHVLPHTVSTSATSSTPPPPPPKARHNNYLGTISGVLPSCSTTARSASLHEQTRVYKTDLIAELKQSHAACRNLRSRSEDCQPMPLESHVISESANDLSSNNDKSNELTSKKKSNVGLMQAVSEAETQQRCQVSSNTQKTKTPTKIRTTPKRPAPPPPVEPTVIHVSDDHSTDEELKPKLSPELSQKSVTTTSATVDRSSTSSPSKDSAYSSGTANGRTGTSLSQYLDGPGSDRRTRSHQLSKTQQNSCSSSNNSSEYLAIVGIDFGSAAAGYTWTLTSDDQHLDMSFPTRNNRPCISQTEGRKYPSCLLLNSDKTFNSFGYVARQRFFALTPQTATKHFFFEFFRDQVTEPLPSASGEHVQKILSHRGESFSAVEIFAHVLRCLTVEAVGELQSLTGQCIQLNQCQWIVTVPTSWRQMAKQLIRRSAVNAGLISDMNSEQLVVILEVDAAATFCRTLLEPDADCSRSFAVLNCGSATLDFGVYKTEPFENFSFHELGCGSIGRYGAYTLGMAFEELLCDIFTKDFVIRFRSEYPAAFAEIRAAFDTKKDSAFGETLNITLPVSFINSYKKCRWHSVSCAVDKYNRTALIRNAVSWSSQGFLQIKQEFVDKMYSPIVAAIRRSLKPALLAVGIEHIDRLFLVGGFSLDSVLQTEIRTLFNDTKLIVPQNPVLAAVRGTIVYGIQPERIISFRARQTYGIGVLHRFRLDEHPESKRLQRGGVDWCVEVFEKFVSIGQTLPYDWKETRHYCPATFTQTEILLQIYTSSAPDPQFITDSSVRKCGLLSLKLEPVMEPDNLKQREVAVTMEFKGAELTFRAHVVNDKTLSVAECNLDFS